MREGGGWSLSHGETFQKRHPILNSLLQLWAVVKILIMSIDVVELNSEVGTSHEGEKANFMLILSKWN